jgi:hypothetical protein
VQTDRAHSTEERKVEKKNNERMINIYKFPYYPVTDVYISYLRVTLESTGGWNRH